VQDRQIYLHKVYFDGLKRIQGAGAGVVLISPQGDKLKYVLRMSFPQASNNKAKYEALLHGMKMEKTCGATRLKIFEDSNLVVQQVMNKCDAVSDNMTAYRNLYYYIEGTFDGCKVSHVSRASNEEADNLANIGSQCLPVPQEVFWKEIIERSIKSNKTSTTKEQGQHQAT
jgi:ribonuclease HI